MKWIKLLPTTANYIKKLIINFSEVFTDKLGTKKKKKKTKIVTERWNQTNIFKPKPLPYEIKDQGEKELNIIVKEVSLTPVETCY